MRIALPIHGERISPVLDAARRFVLVDVEGAVAPVRCEVAAAGTDLVDQARRILATGADVLICGAVSNALGSMLDAAGLRLVPDRCGPVDEVIAAFLNGRLGDREYLLPGCAGRGQRGRHRHRYGRWR